MTAALNTGSRATARQVSYLKTLVTDRVTDGLTIPAPEDMSLRNASLWIDTLLKQPRRTAAPAPATARRETPDEALTAGVYETTDGVFVVKPNQAGTRLYAKRLVEINGDRLVESGEHVQIEFEYAPGAIFKLTAADRMAFDKAKALTIRYGKCIVCGHKLKNGVSVERGIGPICRGRFA